MLDKNSKIYIAGHHGLVGSAIWNNLKSRGYNNLVGRTHKELDLTDLYAVEKFFDEEKPDAVVLAAAFVGGHHGEQPLPCRLHYAKHEDAVQRHQQRLLSWCEEAPLLGQHLYLSKGCPTAYERGCPPDIPTGVHL